MAMPDIAETPAEVIVPEKRRMWLSPLNQRRWRNFRRNGRAFWSLIIFMVIFALSLFAEFHGQRQTDPRQLPRRAAYCRSSASTRKPPSAAISRPRRFTVIRRCNA